MTPLKLDFDGFSNGLHNNGALNSAAIANDEMPRPNCRGAGRIHFFADVPGEDREAEELEK